MIKIIIKEENFKWHLEAFASELFIYCVYTYIVSHKSEYPPYISANIVVYLLKGQYNRNETWIYFRVVNVQLV